MKESGRPAGTRLQAAQAIDMYRRRVLMSDDAVLADVLAGLSELAETEGCSERQPDSGSRAAAMPGPLDPHEPPVIRQLRTEIRLCHYLIRTEQAYVRWVQRLLQAHESRGASGLSENEVKEYLSSLAAERNVAAIVSSFQGISGRIALRG